MGLPMKELTVGMAWTVTIFAARRKAIARSTIVPRPSSHGKRIR
jgi:hypothetical protein